MIIRLIGATLLLLVNSVMCMSEAPLSPRSAALSPRECFITQAQRLVGAYGHEVVLYHVCDIQEALFQEACKTKNQANQLYFANPDKDLNRQIANQIDCFRKTLARPTPAKMWFVPQSDNANNSLLSTINSLLQQRGHIATHFGDENDIARHLDYHAAHTDTEKAASIAWHIVAKQEHVANLLKMLEQNHYRLAHSNHTAGINQKTLENKIQNASDDQAKILYNAILDSHTLASFFNPNPPSPWSLPNKTLCVSVLLNLGLGITAAYALSQLYNAHNKD